MGARTQKALADACQARRSAECCARGATCSRSLSSAILTLAGVAPASHFTLWVTQYPAKGIDERAGSDFAAHGRVGPHRRRAMSVGADIRCLVKSA